MTIREAITEYETRKAKWIERDLLYTIHNTCLCVIIPLNNGISIFIDMHPEMEYTRKEYPLELPKKNGIFRRLSFEISGDSGTGILVLPNEILKYVQPSNATGCDYYVDTAKERVVNIFINDNGGINTIAYLDSLDTLFSPTE